MKRKDFIEWYYTEEYDNLPSLLKKQNVQTDIIDLLNEINTLAAQLDDFNETYQNVMAEQCADNEAHCTCVPFLRMEIEKLDKINEQGREFLFARIKQCDGLRAEKRAAISHLRAIVDATLGYAETADAIIEAARWLRKMDGEATQ